MHDTVRVCERCDYAAIEAGVCTHCGLPFVEKKAPRDWAKVSINRRWDLNERLAVDVQYGGAACVGRPAGLRAALNGTPQENNGDLDGDGGEELDRDSSDLDCVDAAIIRMWRFRGGGPCQD